MAYDYHSTAKTNVGVACLALIVSLALVIATMVLVERLVNAIYAQPSHSIGIWLTQGK